MDCRIPIKKNTSAEKVNKSLFAKIIKVDTELRLVYGPVLIPDVEDLQGDVISREEIRQACWNYMEKHQNVGIQHEYINPLILIRECYIAPATFTMNGQVVPEGSWVMGVGVYDDAVWQAVLNGEITGFSIGGYAVREQI